MYGYPKTIQTRHDVEYLMSYLGTDWATDENKSRGMSFLQSLKNTKVYVFDKNLSEGEEPDGPTPDYLVLTDEDGTRRQLRLEDNPNAYIHRLGFTESEVDSLIHQLQGAA